MSFIPRDAERKTPRSGCLSEGFEMRLVDVPPKSGREPVGDNAVAPIRAAGPAERMITSAAIDRPVGPARGLEISR